MDVVDSIIIKLIDNPVTRVNRQKFLNSQLSKIKDNISAECKLEFMENPVKAVGIDTVNKLADGIIRNLVLKSSGISTIIGLPGGGLGAAMSAVDIFQYIGCCIVLSQKLAYLYGLIDSKSLSSVSQKNCMLLCLAFMADVEYKNDVFELFKHVVNSTTLKKANGEILEYTLKNIVVKRIGKLLTKKFGKRVASKFVPVLGGIVSGGMMYFEIKSFALDMKKRLIEYSQQNN